MRDFGDFTYRVRHSMESIKTATKIEIINGGKKDTEGIKADLEVGQRKSQEQAEKL